MKDKQRSRHEDTPTNKLSYLPLSPPTHQKSPQDSHYQSSSSPVGRPPPLLQQPYLFSNQADNDSECDSEMITASDNFVIEEMNAFLLASQEGESSSSSSSSASTLSSSSSSSNINHCFNTLNAYPMDFELYDLLGGNPGDMDDDSMSYTCDKNDLFPTLPNNNTSREA